MTQNESNNKKTCRRAKVVMACMMVGMCVAHASNPVKGLITDQYSKPVSGAVVTQKSTGKSLTTGVDGTFDFDFNKGDVLTITHPMYLQKEITVEKLRDIKSNNTYTIHLYDRFVDTGHSVAQPYTDPVPFDGFLGSSANVHGKELDKYLSGNILTGLQGRMEGFNVSQYRGFATRSTISNTEGSLIGSLPKSFGSGSYGDNSQFIFDSRGMTPVVIVDGVEREMFNIDPEAIESVTLLKDALSSMFLGMRSSRGALIITTKNPTRGKLNLSFTGKLGINSTIKKLKPLSASQYSYLLNEALQNDGKAPRYDYSDYKAYLNHNDPYLHPDINWSDQLLKNNSISQSYNLNVSGGGRVAQFFVSLGYFNEQGPFKTDKTNSYNTNLNLNRYMLSSKVHIKITDDFDATMTALGRIQEGNQPGGGGDNGYMGLFSTIYSTPNNAYPVKNPDGSWGGNVNYANNLYSRSVNSGYISDNQRDIQASLRLLYDLDKVVKGLSVRAIGTVTNLQRTSISRVKTSPVYYYRLDATGNPLYTMYGESKPQSNDFSAVASYNSMTGLLGIDYERTFGMHSIKATLQGDTRHEVDDYDLPLFPSNVLQDISYDYDKRYFAQLTVTESFFNRYAPGRRWGMFYAAGLGWNMAREKFMSDVEWVDKLKLRATYGKTGNGMTNSGYYDFRQTYVDNGVGSYAQGTSQGQGNVFASESSLANPYRTWEKAHKLNIGFDAEFFNRQLAFTADFYTDKYYDLLQYRGKSISFLGISYPSENIGKSRRTGAELTLTWQSHVADFNYYVTANWTIEKTKLLFMDEQRVEYDWQRLTGRPIGVILGLQTDGFLTKEDIASGYPIINGYKVQPGDVKYVDQNEDGVIDDFDRVVIGGDKPIRYFGINLGFEWRGVEFSMLWQGAYKRDMYLGDQTLMQGFLSNGQSYGQAYANLLNRWTPETANTATYPRLSAGGNFYNFGSGWNSSMYMKSGNYLRLKNISLAYNIPECVSRNLLGGVRVKLFVNAQNLLTFSACDLVDPEVAFYNSPLQRCIITGINLKF